jgi:hypothetical protein
MATSYCAGNAARHADIDVILLAVDAQRVHVKLSLMPLLSFEWVDLPASGLAAKADEACCHLGHNDQNV